MGKSDERRAATQITPEAIPASFSGDGSSARGNKVETITKKKMGFNKSPGRL